MGLIGGFLGHAQRVQIIQRDQTVISVDCTTEEKHARESPASTAPLENGTNIADGITIKPFTLDITGIISDTPLSVVNALLTTGISAVAGSVGVIASGVGAALFSAKSGTKSPSLQAYEQLLSLQDGGEGKDIQPLAILTTLKRYENMFIKSISVPRDSGTGQSLLFTVSFNQLIIVSSQTVNILKFSDADMSAAQADEGQQQATSGYAREFKRGQKSFRDTVPRP